MLITKEEIQSLPILTYTGEIELIATAKAWAIAYEELKHEKILGFDTETKPTYVKGPLNTPAIMQIASSRKVYVIQLFKTKLTPAMVEILSNENILKVGIAIHDDMTFLQKHAKFKPESYLDLAKLAHQKGFEESGLRTLCAKVLAGRLSKTMQCSNWERSLLSSGQLQYAATDAWVSLELYNTLIALPDNPLPVKESAKKVNIEKVKTTKDEAKSTSVKPQIKIPSTKKVNPLAGKAKAKPKAKQKKQK